MRKDVDIRELPGGEIHQPPHLEYKERDLNAAVIYKFLFGLFIAAIVIHVAIWGLMEVFELQTKKNEPEVSPLAPKGPQTPPSPRLQVAPYQDLEKQRAEDSKMVGEYEWIDQPSGKVKLPVDVAMKRYLQMQKTNGTQTQQTQTAPAQIPGETMTPPPPAQPNTQTPAAQDQHAN